MEHREPGREPPSAPLLFHRRKHHETAKFLLELVETHHAVQRVHGLWNPVGVRHHPPSVY
jgi:hypothetical protein